jgi:hypothetical protein
MRSRWDQREPSSQRGRPCVYQLVGAPSFVDGAATGDETTLPAATAPGLSISASGSDFPPALLKGTRRGAEQR